MNILRKRMIAVLLSMVVAATMLVALSTQAYAAHSDTEIDIYLLGGTNASGANWTYNGGTTTITVLDDVAIIGAKLSAINGTTLTIVNTANKTVTWRAIYQGNLNKDPDVHYLIEMTGGGVLDIVGSAKIHQLGDSGAVLAMDSTVNVSGNSVVYSEATSLGNQAHTLIGYVVTVSGATRVENRSSGSAIWFVNSITISGNAWVLADSGTAIYCGYVGAAPNSHITIEGGVVESGSGNAIYANSSTVNVDGGVVKSSGLVTTISGGSNTGSVTVNGDGEVKSTSGVAIWLENPASSVIVNSGTITSENGTTIIAEGSVVLDDATVMATTGRAIFAGNVRVIGASVVGNDGTQPAITINAGNGSLYTDGDAAHLTVYGNVRVTGAGGGVSGGFGYLEINGDVELTGNASWVGAGALGSSLGMLNILGDVNSTADGSWVTTVEYGIAYVEGDVTFSGKDAAIFSSDDSVILIGGLVTFAGDDAIIISLDNSEIAIFDDVIFSAAGGEIIARDGGAIFLFGTVTGNPDIIIEFNAPIAVGSPTETGVELPFPFDGFYWDAYTDVTADPQSFVFIAGDVRLPDDGTSTVPGTGDNTALMLLLGALMATALGTGAVVAYRRREQKD